MTVGSPLLITLSVALLVLGLTAASSPVGPLITCSLGSIAPLVRVRQASAHEVTGAADTGRRSRTAAPNGPTWHNRGAARPVVREPGSSWRVEGFVGPPPHQPPSRPDLPDEVTYRWPAREAEEKAPLHQSA